MKKNNLGLVHVYTGDGKGKTTAALGLALRAAGQGFRVGIIQFMKKGDFGEFKALKKFRNIEIKQFGRQEFVDLEKPESEDGQAAQAALGYALEIMRQKKVDLLILDEINVAAHFNLITEDDIIALIKDKPKEMELVLTGRYASPKVIKMSNLATEMKKIKHYFDRGTAARRGIEY